MVSICPQCEIEYLFLDCGCRVCEECEYISPCEAMQDLISEVVHNFMEDIAVELNDMFEPQYDTSEFN